MTGSPRTTRPLGMASRRCSHLRTPNCALRWSTRSSRWRRCQGQTDGEAKCGRVGACEERPSHLKTLTISYSVGASHRSSQLLTFRTACRGRGAPRRRCRATGLGQRRSLAKTRCKSIERRANADATKSERPNFTVKFGATAAWQSANTLPATLLLPVRLDHGPGRTAAARDRSYARTGGSAGAPAPDAEHGKAGEGEVGPRPPNVF